MQAALAQEQAHSSELRKTLDKKIATRGDGGGIIDAVRKGQMKDIAPKKYVSIRASGHFRAGE